jgi:hypothetical protein
VALWTFIGNGGCQMQPNKSALAEPVDVFPVEQLPQYVIGFPVYVVLTVRATPNVGRGLLTFPDFLDLRGRVGLVMLRGNTEIVRFMPSDEAPRVHEEPSGDRLEAGETRRMLIDISPLFPSPLDEGEYEIRLAWVGVRETFDAAPIRIKLRRPTALEIGKLTSVAPDRDKFLSWGEWTRTCSGVPTTPESIDPNDPLAFNMILRRLFCSPIGPDRADVDELSSLGGLFAPECNALKVELYQARGNTTEANRLMAELSESQPGLAWWLRTLAAGHGGYIATFRNPVPPR